MADRKRMKIACPKCGHPIAAATRQERLINENIAIERTLAHIVNQLSQLRESTKEREKNEGIKSAIRIVRMQLEASRLPKLEGAHHG